MEYIGIIEDDAILLPTQGDIIIFGAGQGGRKVLDNLRTVNVAHKVKGFCDNDSKKWGHEIEGIKIYSEEQIKDIFGDPIIIIASIYDKQIYNQLKEKNYTHIHIAINLTKNKNEYETFIKNSYTQWKKYLESNTQTDMYLEQVKKLFDDELSKITFTELLKARETGEWDYYAHVKQDLGDQYFDPKIFKFREAEIFVDLGAHTGDTIELFIKRVNNKYKQIYAFEPSRTIYTVLENYVARIHASNIKLFNMGTWYEKASLSFTTNENHLASSGVRKNGKEIIKVDKLDNLFKERPVTFIKMDIEGSEKETLLGASEIIKKYRPKLAISVYHKPEDIFEIPFFIKKLVPDYKLYLRHYTYGQSETVLYATI